MSNRTCADCSVYCDAKDHGRTEPCEDFEAECIDDTFEDVECAMCSNVEVRYKDEDGGDDE